MRAWKGCGETGVVVRLCSLERLADTPFIEHTACRLEFAVELLQIECVIAQDGRRLLVSDQGERAER
jgi:hypothetical protein